MSRQNDLLSFSKLNAVRIFAFFQIVNMNKYSRGSSLLSSSGSSGQSNRRSCWNCYSIIMLWKKNVFFCANLVKKIPWNLTRSRNLKSTLKRTKILSVPLSDLFFRFCFTWFSFNRSFFSSSIRFLKKNVSLITRLIDQSSGYLLANSLAVLACLISD